MAIELPPDSVVLELQSSVWVRSVVKVPGPGTIRWPVRAERRRSLRWAVPPPGLTTIDHQHGSLVLVVAQHLDMLSVRAVSRASSTCVQYLSIMHARK